MNWGHQHGRVSRAMRLCWQLEDKVFLRDLKMSSCTSSSRRPWLRRPPWELMSEKDVFEQSLVEDPAVRSRRGMANPS